MTTVEQSTHDTAVLAELAEALNRLRAGDVKVRLRRRTGLAGEVVDALNEVIARQDRQVRDLVRISRVVGREGRLTERLDEADAAVGHVGVVDDRDAAGLGEQQDVCEGVPAVRADRGTSTPSRCANCRRSAPCSSRGASRRRRRFGSRCTRG